MAAHTLQELLTELEAKLHARDGLSDEDRALLTRLQADLASALASPSAAAPTPVPSVSDNLRDVLERVQAQHPDLANLLRATLDALSDVGV